MRPGTREVKDWEEAVQRLVRIIGVQGVLQLEAQIRAVVEGTGYGAVQVEIRDGKPSMINVTIHTKFDFNTR